MIRFFLGGSRVIQYLALIFGKIWEISPFFFKNQNHSSSMFKLGLYTLNSYNFSHPFFFRFICIFFHFRSQQSARNGCESLCSAMVTLQGAELRAQGFFWWSQWKSTENQGRSSSLQVFLNVWLALIDFTGDIMISVVFLTSCKTPPRSFQFPSGRKESWILGHLKVIGLK